MVLFIMRVGLGLLAMTTAHYAGSETLLKEFPSELVGTWVQPTKHEEGIMLVHVSEHTSTDITGILEIKGSKDCPQSVAFHGNIENDRVVIKSSSDIVCGYDGVLTGEVRKAGDDSFVGNFAYQYKVLNWTFTWASGTFVLHIPPKQK